jgi:5,10-methylenetetrahydromethanopterin reductase
MNRRPPFDFAFVPAGPVQETVELVRLGERLGYRCAWLPDQTFHRDPFVLLGVCAQATQEIGLGVGITSPFTRLPAQIARAAAVVDEISGGRFRLGLGTANPDTVLGPLGLELTNPYRRLRDAITIIRQLLAGKSVNFDGRFDHLQGVQLDFVPTRPSLPIYIGTRGPKLLELTGETADGVLSESLFSGDGMSYVREHVTAGVIKSQRSLRDVDIVSWQLVRVTTHPHDAVADQRPWAARSIKIGPRDVMIRLGVEEGVVDRVTEAARRGDWDSAINHVTDDAVNRLMIIGSPSDITQRMSEIFQKGANSVSLLLLGRMDEVRNTLTRFAREVMPKFA